jgi:hypothetical protein
VKRLIVALALFCVLSREAKADPSTGVLVAAGIGMAIPDYFYGVFQHEGSHALWATIFGAHVTKMRILPAHIDGYFYFGYTTWDGQLSRGKEAWTLVAPKLPDLLIMGGFATLVGLEALPSNKYGALALTVLATGAWVDFTKDAFSTSNGDDLVKAHNLYGQHSEWKRLPYRIVHVALAAGAAYFLYRGYEDVFRKSSTMPVVFSLWQTAF